MPITNCEATPQTPAPGCCPTRLLEQSLTDLMQRLCSSTWALSAREADAVVAVVSDVLLQSSAATERELILALSCTAMLSTRQGAGTALMAARGNLSHQANGAPSHLAFASADASNTTVVSSSPPSDALSTSGPAVLPLLPLLAAVAAGDEAAAEMALRRLNRCLGRPLSAANPIAATTVQCAATNTPSIRSNRIWSSNGDGQGGGEDLLAGCYADTTLGSLSSLLLAPEDDGEFRSLVRGEWEGARGSLASSRGGGDDSVCSSGALAAASWESARYRSRCCLSLLAAQQAEARVSTCASGGRLRDIPKGPGDITHQYQQPILMSVSVSVRISLTCRTHCSSVGGGGGAVQACGRTAMRLQGSLGGGCSRGRVPTGGLCRRTGSCRCRCQVPPGAAG
ncbi:hypothetical protein Vretimale_18006 [Volvox reticuliferus]|uniref:Uncharacterized protein n=1 Tax=Volvox reticuliferus TaxID=1737510 RepID=A0A8J4GWD3_9CHLO|nr:hypothetical protein Vretifemale_17723 [Volvox reticuliferus]GIM15205.1 hypothetical protein Vretimale_18006 [Volvox reticuliferus]